MAVDLGDLIESLQREVNPPGTNLLPNATEDEYLGHLSDAFWETVMFGVISGYEENAAARGGDAEFGEGVIVPRTFRDDATYDDDAGGYLDGTDLSRELQQVIVLYAGYRILLSEFRNISTMVRGKAGPVEFEQQKSANVLKEALAAVKQKIDYVLATLSSHGGSDTTVLDAVIERSYLTAIGEQWWVR